MTARKLAARAWTANILRLTPAAFLTFGLVLSEGCGGRNEPAGASSPHEFGPAVSDHPFLQKWSSHRLEKAASVLTVGANLRQLLTPGLKAKGVKM